MRHRDENEIDCNDCFDYYNEYLDQQYEEQQLMRDTMIALTDGACHEGMDDENLSWSDISLWRETHGL